MEIYFAFVETKSVLFGFYTSATQLVCLTSNCFPLQSFLEKHSWATELVGQRAKSSHPSKAINSQWLIGAE